MPDQSTGTGFNALSLAGPIGQVVGAGIGAIATGSMNRKTRAFQSEWAYRQREWAEADWLRQNAYNSPSAQMARLREAKLNPALIYGKGPGDMSTGPIRSTSSPDWKPDTPDYGRVGESVGHLAQGYYDTQMKKQSLENMAAQNTVLHEQAAMIEAQRIALGTNVEKTKVDTEIQRLTLGIRNALQSTDIEFRKQQLRKLFADTSFTLHEDERKAASNSQSIKESIERILTLRFNRVKGEAERQQILQNIENLKKTGELQQLDIDLKKLGIQPGDNMGFRVAGRIVQSLTDWRRWGTATPDSPGDSTGSALKNVRWNFKKK